MGRSSTLLLSWRDEVLSVASSPLPLSSSRCVLSLITLALGAMKGRQDLWTQWFAAYRVE
jgi:hypothetical protein